MSISFSLQPSKNLFNGHINQTSTHSDAILQVKRPQLPEGYCYCPDEHLEKGQCKGASSQTINIEDIIEDGCILDSDNRGVPVLSDLLSFGKNNDYDPNALLVSKLDEDENNDATLRLLEASLNNKSISATGSPGRIGELATTADNVINNEENGINSRLVFPDINIGDSGSSIRVPSKGIANLFETHILPQIMINKLNTLTSHKLTYIFRLGGARNSATSLCEDILRNSGPSFNLCQRFIDVDR